MDPLAFGQPQPRLPCRGALEVRDDHGFLRVRPDRTPNKDDVYVSAAQIRRFALHAGDVVDGEMRAPIGRELYHSLVGITRVHPAPSAD
jgi:transcription termination factor Rho